jgi:hypothetical protein
MADSLLDQTRQNYENAGQTFEGSAAALGRACAQASAGTLKSSMETDRPGMVALQEALGGGGCVAIDKTGAFLIAYDVGNTVSTVTPAGQ